MNYFAVFRVLNPKPVLTKAGNTFAFQPHTQLAASLLFIYLPVLLVLLEDTSGGHTTEVSIICGTLNMVTLKQIGG